jgi:hypothetical protein
MSTIKLARCLVGGIDGGTSRRVFSLNMMSSYYPSISDDYCDVSLSVFCGESSTFISLNIRVRV